MPLCSGKLNVTDCVLRRGIVVNRTRTKNEAPEQILNPPLHIEINDPESPNDRATIKHSSHALGATDTRVLGYPARGTISSGILN